MLSNFMSVLFKVFMCAQYEAKVIIIIIIVFPGGLVTSLFLFPNMLMQVQTSSDR